MLLLKQSVKPHGPLIKYLSVQVTKYTSRVPLVTVVAKSHLSITVNVQSSTSYTLQLTMYVVPVTLQSTWELL